tara:strand:- start:370 stop:495 length:126 start_codon:yes stop_codon:yes gene_type:complete
MVKIPIISISITVVVVAIIGTNKSIGTIIAEFPIKEIVPFG